MQNKLKGAQNPQQMEQVESGLLQFSPQLLLVSLQYAADSHMLKLLWTNIWIGHKSQKDQYKNRWASS